MPSHIQCSSYFYKSNWLKISLLLLPVFLIDQTFGFKHKTSSYHPNCLQNHVFSHTFHICVIPIGERCQDITTNTLDESAFCGFGADCINSKCQCAPGRIPYDDMSGCGRKRIGKKISSQGPINSEHPLSTETITSPSPSSFDQMQNFQEEPIALPIRGVKGGGNTRDRQQQGLLQHNNGTRKNSVAKFHHPLNNGYIMGISALVYICTKLLFVKF